MNTAKFALYVLVCGAVILTAMPALAYTVTVYVEGVVTEIYTFDGLEFDGSLVVGSVMTGSCTYDSETPDQAWHYWTGEYSLTSISMQIGSYTCLPNWQGESEPVFYISAEPGGFFYNVGSPEALFSGPCYVNGEPANLEDSPGGRFGLMSLVAGTISPIGDTLPDENTFPDLSVFTEGKSFELRSGYTPSFDIFGQITSVTVVPEPASALVLGVGAVMLILRRRFR